jgi:hypothetical protein
LLDKSDIKTDIEKEIDEAESISNFSRFEELVKAALAQYVIWIKRDTAPTIHVASDLRQMLVKIDMPALSDHIHRLEKVLAINGHSDSFLPHLRNLSRIIGVPELSIRITALAAQWLFKNGNYLGAVKELESLGNIECLNDTLALVLSVNLLDLPVHKRGQFISRAVSGALWEEERLSTELELVRHFSDSGQQTEALRKLDSVIAELTKMRANSSLQAEAMSLRWYITKEEQDFQAAKEALGISTDKEYRQHLAAILIDYGDYDAAERVLSDILIAGDPVAQLLITDARLRANQADSARELLLSISPDCVTPHLQYPHAVAYALVALACADTELKRLASAKLRQLPPFGPQAKKNVDDLLEALEVYKNMQSKSIISRFRDLLPRRR